MATRQQIDDAIERYQTSPRVGPEQREAFTQSLKDHRTGMRFGFGAAAFTLATGLALNTYIGSRIAAIEQEISDSPVRIHNLGERFYSMNRSGTFRQAAISQAAVSAIAQEQIDLRGYVPQIDMRTNVVTFYPRQGGAPLEVDVNPWALAREYRKALETHKEMSVAEKETSRDWTLILAGCFALWGFKQQGKRDAQVQKALDWFGVK